MTTVHAVPIGAERFTGSAELTVRSPYDGSELGRVPRCGAAEVEAAVAAARSVHRSGPMPQWVRAEILERAARLLQERREVFAEVIAAEAAKPIRSARIEANGPPPP